MASLRIDASVAATAEMAVLAGVTVEAGVVAGNVVGAKAREPVVAPVGALVARDGDGARVLASTDASAGEAAGASGAVDGRDRRRDIACKLPTAATMSTLRMFLMRANRPAMTTSFVRLRPNSGA